MATSEKVTVIEHELKAIIASRKLPPDLAIMYDDMHGLWGGMTVVLRGNGEIECAERKQGATEAELVETSIEPDCVLELIELLLRLEAWQQKAPEQQPVPDEVRAMLMLRVNGQESQVWEWANDPTQRLPEIKTRLRELMRKT